MIGLAQGLFIYIACRAHMPIRIRPQPSASWERGHPAQVPKEHIEPLHFPFPS